jgi:hypothetical protein
MIRGFKIMSDHDLRPSRAIDSILNSIYYSTYESTIKENYYGNYCCK